MSAADLLTGTAVPLYHARHDRWEKYFAWSAGFLLICGLTPIGRATVEKLKLNHETVVNLRRLLREIGAHPVPMASARRR